MTPVFVEAVSAGSVRPAIQRAAKRFPHGYAAVLKKARQRWLIYANERIQLRAIHCYEHAVCKAGIALSAAGEVVNLCAWRGGQLVVCAWGSEQQVSFLLAQLVTQNDYRPEVFLADSVPTHVSNLAKQLWSEQVKVFPELAEQKKLTLMLPIRRLNASTSLLFIVVAAAVCMLWYGYHSYMQSKVLAVEAESAPQLYQEIRSSHAQPTPLFRLDYQLQTLLQDIPGWQVVQVEYSPRKLSYRFVQQQGLQSELRRFAQRHGLHAHFQEGQAGLSRGIGLPESAPDLDWMSWHSVTELTDWLDERLRLWLSSTTLSLGELSHDQGWQRQRLRIVLDGAYIADLLTLAGILDGLPVALEHMSYRQQNGQVVGVLSLIAYGREPT